MAHDRRDGQTVYRLAFPGRPGLTVRLRRASLAGMIDIAEATPVLRRNVHRDEAQTELDNLRAWRRLARAFASALLDWDLLDGGDPVPATFAGVMSLELEEVMDLVAGWRQAMATTQTEPETEPEPDVQDGPAPGDETEAEPDVWDPENPKLDEEWIAQLPVQEVSAAEVMADA